MLKTYLDLIRVRLSLMVALSAGAGYLLTGIGKVSELPSLLTGVFLFSAASSMINQVQEADRDSRMQRTVGRPIPAGKITSNEAMMLCIGHLVVILLLWHSHPEVLMLGFLNLLFYNGIYTPLKPRTWLAIFPGALVGAVPPLMGWVFGGLDLTDFRILFLSGFVFLWQIPHFWLLMIRYHADYHKAGFATVLQKITMSRVKKIVFGWSLITTLYLGFFPKFDIHLPGLFPEALMTINLAFISLFFYYLFVSRAERPIRSAFILINLHALLIFMILAIGA